MTFLIMVGLLIGLYTSSKHPFTMFAIGFMSGLWFVKLMEVLGV